VPHRFLPLATLHDLDDALAASMAGPVLLFKHSQTCGTSAMANEELLDMMDDCPAPMYRLDVWTARPVSNAIAERFGIRHASPQVLIVDRGEVVWHATHYRITAHEVRARFNEAVSRRTAVSSGA
jgi:bacillithiol system protein YtxJ